jgi:hypothetical protein
MYSEGSAGCRPMSIPNINFRRSNSDEVMADRYVQSEHHEELMFPSGDGQCHGWLYPRLHSERGDG